MVDRTPSAAPRPDSTSVLDKVVRILDALGDRGVLGVSELARVTGLAKATVHRQATTMVDLGLVERSGDGYRLGPKLFELGSRVPGPRRFREAALPYLEDLSQVTRQTVHLAVLDGIEVLYIERLVGTRSNEVPSAVATRLPLHCTATGKCLLAFGPTALVDTVMSQPLQSLTPRSITSATELTDLLDQVRAVGLATEVEEVVEGVQSIAAPVWELGGDLAGAISATGPIDEFDESQVGALVRLAAAGLSRRLGSS